MIYIIILIIFLSLLLLKNLNCKEKFRNFPDVNNYTKYNKYNNIWLYWENKPGKTKPEYLKLCEESVYKHCSEDFRIYLLDENTVYDFLPNLRKDINQLTIPQKTDYIRLHLLNKYGGIWLDSDILVMQNLLPIVYKLNNYDFVGFGCHYRNCSKGGYGSPANWVMASKKNGILIDKCINNCDKILKKNTMQFLNNKSNYFKLGRNIIWDQIKYCKKNIKNWDYYHFDSKCLERDSNHVKIRNKRLISKENIDPKCENKMLFIPIYNTAPGFPKWFLNLNKEQLLKQNLLISKLFRKSLN